MTFYLLLLDSMAAMIDSRDTCWAVNIHDGVYRVGYIHHHHYRVSTRQKDKRTKDKKRISNARIRGFETSSSSP